MPLSSHSTRRVTTRTSATSAPHFSDQQAPLPRFDGTLSSVAHVVRSQQVAPVPQALEAVHAGFPSVAQDYFLSDFSFDEHVITHPETTFAVRVAGDSMRGAGIYDGDLLLVDRSLEPQTRDVVIAVVDDELTVKRLEKDHNGQPILHPENPNYPDITLSDGQELSIWGVVMGNYHYQHRETSRWNSTYGQE